MSGEGRGESGSQDRHGSLGGEPVPATERPSWEGHVVPSNVRRATPEAPDGDVARDTESGEGGEWWEEEGEDEREPSGADLLRYWVAATAAGWALAGVLLAAVLPDPSTLWQYAFYPISAVGQWLILRRRFARASLWLVATVAGVAVAAAGAAVVFRLPASALGAPNSGLRGGVSTFFDGLALGMAQWLVLRRTVRDAERWIPAAAAPFWFFALLALLQGGGSPEAIADMTRAMLVTASGVQFAILGALVGAGTGAVLVGLVRRPR